MKKLRILFNKVVVGSILESLIYAIFGLFLIIKTDAATDFLVRSFGFVLLISGLFSVIRFLFRKLALKIFNVSILNALIKIILGFIVIIKPLLVTNLLFVSIGLVLLINGLIKLYYAFNFYNSKEEIWALIGMLAIGLIIMGGSLIINPFNQGVLLTRMAGMFIICYAVFDTMQWLLFRKRSKELLLLFK